MPTPPASIPCPAEGPSDAALIEATVTDMTMETVAEVPVVPGTADSSIASGKAENPMLQVSSSPPKNNDEPRRPPGRPPKTKNNIGGESTAETGPTSTITSKADSTQGKRTSLQIPNVNTVPKPTSKSHRKKVPNSVVADVKGARPELATEESAAKRARLPVLDSTGLDSGSTTNKNKELPIVKFLKESSNISTLLETGVKLQKEQLLLLRHQIEIDAKRTETERMLATTLEGMQLLLEKVLQKE